MDKMAHIRYFSPKSIEIEKIVVSILEANLTEDDCELLRQLSYYKERIYKKVKSQSKKD